MKAKLFITLAVAAVLGASIVACGSLKGGEEEKTTPTPTPVPTPTPEAGKVNKTTVGSTTTYAGSLRGVNDSNKFDIFTEDSEISVEFTYPTGADYGVKVIGMSGDELGDFALDEGEIIDLTGGGKFTIIVYSSSGEGPWTATYTED
ncbi:MAG: hypothetical protein JSU81_00230 [Candidatus Coatesbacteria bacterium]|nr:MAG: hypothetical protein JSU81_00230 [Candidatus Coatesbacteria bacterium]